MVPDIDSNQVNQAESSRFWITNCRSGDCIHFLNGVAVFQDVIESKRCAAKSDAVGDEVRCIFGRDDAFAKLALTETADKFHNLRKCVGRGDNFQQLQVTRWIEEMRTQKVLTEAG